MKIKSVQTNIEFEELTDEEMKEFTDRGWMYLPGMSRYMGHPVMSMMTKGFPSMKYLDADFMMGTHTEGIAKMSKALEDLASVSAKLDEYKNKMERGIE